jgi:hypothetical protein
VGVSAEDLSCLVQPQVRTALPALFRRSEPGNGSLRIVVERTFTGYWGVEGLQEAGADVCLAPPLGLEMSTGTHVTTERREAVA